MNDLFFKSSDCVKPLMSCGHSANFKKIPDEESPEIKIWSCDICEQDFAFDLSILKGRKARCSCGTIADSHPSLQMFHYIKHEKYDRFWCGCDVGFAFFKRISDDIKMIDEHKSDKYLLSLRQSEIWFRKRDNMISNLSDLPLYKIFQDRNIYGNMLLYNSAGYTYDMPYGSYVVSINSRDTNIVKASQVDENNNINTHNEFHIDSCLFNITSPKGINALNFVKNILAETINLFHIVLLNDLDYETLFVISDMVANNGMIIVENDKINIDMHECLWNYFPVVYDNLHRTIIILES